MAFGRKPLIGLYLGAVVVLVAVGACKSDAPAADESDAGGSIGGFGDGKKKKTDAGVIIPCTKDPAYYDVPGDDCDNDDDGTVDNPPTCDASDDPDPAVAMARALGICDDVATRGYGLVSAKLTRGFGRDQAALADQHALMTKFGDVIVPREGKKMALMSTGFAQEFDGAPGADFDGVEWEDIADGTNGLPPGFPKSAKGCPQDKNTRDVIALHLELKAPKNSSGFAFDFDFYTAEWPQYICNKYNDTFIAYLTAASFKGGAGDNVSFDALGNPVSVNNGFFDRCVPGIPSSCLKNNKCLAGPSELEGTGFGIREDLFLPACGTTVNATKGGATGWLVSTAPIGAEEQFTVDFILSDTSDAILDSSILLDNFRWVLGNVPVEPVTERPPDVK